MTDAIKALRIEITYQSDGRWGWAIKVQYFTPIEKGGMADSYDDALAIALERARSMALDSGVVGGGI